MHSQLRPGASSRRSHSGGDERRRTRYSCHPRRRLHLHRPSRRQLLRQARFCGQNHRSTRHGRRRCQGCSRSRRCGKELQPLHCVGSYHLLGPCSAFNRCVARHHASDRPCRWRIRSRKQAFGSVSCHAVSGGWHERSGCVDREWVFELYEAGVCDWWI